MSIYDELNVKRLINAWGPITRVGGSRMRPEVVQAMVEASGAFVDLDDLQQRAGQRIAAMIGVDGCYITCGCAAGLTIATAAVLAGTDPDKIARLPDTTGMKNEVIVQHHHRNGYDHAVRQVGVKFVEVGTSEGSSREEFENAFNENTAAVFHTYARWTFNKPMQLTDVVEIAHARGVPVIVDAAAEVPPLRNLKGLWETGADLVVFSGGKGIRGPQNTGLVLGRPELIAACAKNGNPNHSIGRPMKVGKEEMAGIVKAVELYLAQDHDADFQRMHQQVATVEKALANTPGVTTERIEAGYSVGIPVLQIKVDEKVARLSATALAEQLAKGEPGIRLACTSDQITVNPHFVEKGEEVLIAKRLAELLKVPVGVR